MKKPDNFISINALDRPIIKLPRKDGYIAYAINKSKFVHKTGLFCPSCPNELLTSRKFRVGSKNNFDDMWLCDNCGHLWDELWIRGYSTALICISEGKEKRESLDV